jgi:predicted dehydrogenase
MLVSFGQSNLLQKARAQPEKVKMVLDKVKTDGLVPTINAVRNKLDEPIPLGYCNVGIVEEIGAGVSGYRKGDRVISNGSHAEFVAVGEKLCAKIPDGVSDQEAAFTVISAIGLQGIRLLKPTFGETVVVTGLGLIGLLAGQLLIANGCRVIGLEPDPTKRKLANTFGIETTEATDPVMAVMEMTDGVGADAVLITASAKTNAIISQAAGMCRQRGRVILVGVIGLKLDRGDFYKKEISFQVSCSYGPGRHDEDYEGRGKDYPVGFVRWTEQRNFQAVLHALAHGQLKVESLISEVVAFDDMGEVYGNIANSNSIATLFRYPEAAPDDRTITVGETKFSAPEGKAWGIVGAGNFTKMTMLPILDKVKAPVAYIASAGGVSATGLAKKHGIGKSTTDFAEMLTDPSVGLVAITTRHNLHASMVMQALAAGKDVFVEKPLALSEEELGKIVAARTTSRKNITIGFNRRFSPHTEAVKKHLPTEIGKNMVATMNAGFIPPEVWVHDMQIGGGRIIGEACHFIDLLVHLSGSLVTEVCMNALGQDPEENTDNASILLRFANGDNGTVHYFGNGNKSFPKERVEVFAGQQIFQIDNFRQTTAYGVKGFSKLKTRLDKGHARQFELLHERFAGGGGPLISLEEQLNVTRASFAALASLKSGAWVSVEP